LVQITWKYIGERVVVMMKKPLRSQQQNWVCGIVGIHHHRIQGSRGSGGGDASNTRESIRHEPRHTYLCCVLMEEANAPLSSPPQTQPPHPFFYLTQVSFPCHLEQPICCISQNHHLHKFTFLLCSLNSKTDSSCNPESSFAQVSFWNKSQPTVQRMISNHSANGLFYILQGKETSVCKKKGGTHLLLTKDDVMVYFVSRVRQPIWEELHRFDPMN
jgi:hypothetical protein